MIIFGELVGGFSVFFFLLIFSNKRLFYCVNVESGVLDFFFFLFVYVKIIFIILGDVFGCVYDLFIRNFKIVFFCIRLKFVEEILNVLDKVGIYFLLLLMIEILFVLVIDGELFNDFLFKVLVNDLLDELVFFKFLDMIIGNCNMEGFLYLGMML